MLHLKRGCPLLPVNFGECNGPVDEVMKQPDMVMRVPFQGVLPSLPESVTSKYLEPVQFEASVVYLPLRSFSGSYFPRREIEPKTKILTVEFPLRTDYERDMETEHKVVMPWVTERNEWVALVYRRWMESFPREDEYWEGSYQLDSFCTTRLREAWGIPINYPIPPEYLKTDPGKTSPEILKTSGERAQSVTFSILFYDPRDDDMQWAVDWSWMVPDRWTLSYKARIGGAKWYIPPENSEGIKRISHVLTDSFGLRSEKGYSPEQILMLDPRQLAKIGSKDPMSNTHGDYRRASEVRKVITAS